MIIYNLTYILNEAIVDSWLNWLDNNLKPNCDTHKSLPSYKILKIINSPNEGLTLCIQFAFENLNKLDAYKNQFETDFENKMWASFENQYVCYKSIMEELIV